MNGGFIAGETPELISIPRCNGRNSLEVVAMLTKVVKEQQKAQAWQQGCDDMPAKYAVQLPADAETASVNGPEGSSTERLAKGAGTAL